ncbi:MAG TPA: DHA2 family efflux MFS transporter permease subunit [Thermoleophilaceae bacterium]|nr:DHA2 family efflux MFS transporter permease subunit [Thermoleophilaceae bacterium]
MKSRTNNSGWTFAIVSTALFMVVLDNLVVTNALPSIKRDLGAGIQQLEWTVNAYTLSYAVLLLTGAAIGDRFGRRRVFSLGLGLFTLASAAAAVAPSTSALIAARAVQGVGAAVVTPLTLTLLSEAVPVEKRGLAIGAWSGISGLAVALGPVVGGAVVTGISWHWIFWLNVPIGLVAAPLAMARLSESYGESRGLDLPGVGLASAGLLGLVYGIVHASAAGWTAFTVIAPMAGGALLLAAFVVWELRAEEPMLPMSFFRSRAFTATNGVSIAMYFGTFGSVFLLAQFFQVAQGYSALQSGLRILPWTVMPMFIAPLAGWLSDRIGGRPLMAAGLALQGGGLAWLASATSPTVAYIHLVPGFVMAGAGMALVFAPAANTVLGAVRPKQAGQASGATNALRELGGVLGISVLATVFSGSGGYLSPQDYVDGLIPAITVGSAVLFAGALVALLVPAKRRQRSNAQAEAVTA